MVTPEFRRGKQRKKADNYTLRYRHVTIDHAEDAWEHLVRYSYGKYRNSIAKDLMEVGKNISALYRRVFHEMGIAEDIPGEWNGMTLEEMECYLPAFDGSAIEDDTEGYAEWTDPESFNIPAQVRVHERDPRAFRKRWEEMTEGEDLGLWVATRYIERGSAPKYNDSVPRFARWESVPASVGLEGQRRRAIAHVTNRPVEEVGHERGCDNEYIYYWGRNPSGDPLLPQASDEAPPLLLLAPGLDSRRLAAHASEASTASRCPTLQTGTFGATDLARAMGYSRETAKRRLPKWEDMGLVTHLGYGQWDWTTEVP